MVLLHPARLLIFGNFQACMIITSCTFIRYSRVPMSIQYLFKKLCQFHFKTIFFELKNESMYCFLQLKEMETIHQFPIKPYDDKVIYQRYFSCNFQLAVDFTLFPLNFKVLNLSIHVKFLHWNYLFINCTKKSSFQAPKQQGTPLTL